MATVPTLTRWASRYLAAEWGALVLVDPEETEMALAAYAHAIDEQLAGTRGTRRVFPDGQLQVGAAR